MMEMDAQLTSLDNTFAWNCMVGKARQASHVNGGNESATGGKSRDASSVPTPQLVQVPPFPIPTTIEPLFKRVREEDGPSIEPP